MSKVIRFGVSVPEKLLMEYDQLLSEQEYSNRSEAVRDLIRDRLAEEEWRRGSETVFGTITLVYDHAAGDVVERLMEVSHEHHEIIVSNLHLHIDHHHCMEVLLVKGVADMVRRLAGAVIGMRGILHGKLTLVTTGSRLNEE